MKYNNKFALWLYKFIIKIKSSENKFIHQENKNNVYFLKLDFKIIGNALYWSICIM